MFGEDKKEQGKKQGREKTGDGSLFFFLV